MNYLGFSLPPGSHTDHFIAEQLAQSHFTDLVVGNLKPEHSHSQTETLGDLTGLWLHTLKSVVT